MNMSTPSSRSSEHKMQMQSAPLQIKWIQPSLLTGSAEHAKADWHCHLTQLDGSLHDADGKFYMQAAISFNTATQIHL
jgi:hypothetical protein